MLIYLDDNSVDGVLIRRLTDAGHDVLTPRAAGTAGQMIPFTSCVLSVLAGFF
jgi:hypothetical protein